MHVRHGQYTNVMQRDLTAVLRKLLKLGGKTRSQIQAGMQSVHTLKMHG